MPTITLKDERQSPHDIDIALRKLRKLVDTLGILKDAREKEAYEKPTTKRKRKAAAAIARHKRAQAAGTLPEKQY
jgi:small subunit ribosomal protein S21